MSPLTDSGGAIIGSQSIFRVSDDVGDVLLLLNPAHVQHVHRPSHRDILQGLQQRESVRAQ